MENNTVVELTIEEKKQLINNISLLDIEHQKYIFYIIKSSTDKFTLNNNGVWIDLTNINNNILMEIKKYADACIESKNILQKVNENMINEQTKIILKDNIDKEQSNLINPNNPNKFDFIKKFNENETENESTMIMLSDSDDDENKPAINQSDNDDISDEEF